MLIAFAEGRKNSCRDEGYVDLVYKRSFDSGKTWTDLEILHSASTETDHHTVHNAAPIVDRTTGRIWLLFCQDYEDVYVTYSDDDGETFSSDLVHILHDPKWAATGPGAGIQLQSGRLLAPVVSP